MGPKSKLVPTEKTLLEGSIGILYSKENTPVVVSSTEILKEISVSHGNYTEI